MLTKCADTEDTEVEEPAYHQVRRVPGDQPTERPPQGSVEAGGQSGLTIPLGCCIERVTGIEPRVQSLGTPQ